MTTSLALGGVAGYAVGAAALIPLFAAAPIAAALLRRAQRGLDARSKSHARRALDEMRGSWLARYFAPHAWVPLQQARVQLRLGNGRAAAKAFAEVRRLTHCEADADLVAGEAEGRLMAGDRKDALALFAEIAAPERFSARGRLHLGIAWLSDGGRAKLAVQHLEAAREQIGGGERGAAALVLAYHRVGRMEEALALGAQLAESGASQDDPLTADLVKRAHKVLRTTRRARRPKRAGDRERRVSSTRAPDGSNRPKSAASPGRKRKKGRRTRKREKPGPAREAAEREVAARAAVEREVAPHSGPVLPAPPRLATAPGFHASVALPSRTSRDRPAVPPGTVGLPPVPTVEKRRLGLLPPVVSKPASTTVLAGAHDGWDELLEPVVVAGSARRDESETSPS
ncbi:MAG: hypothetical protein V3V08_03215 [Nannocystaceae bacterium]